jgi:hypothetical protein
MEYVVLKLGAIAVLASVLIAKRQLELKLNLLILLHHNHK